MVSSLHSHPLFYFLGGNRQRSDFLYVSTKTGLPLLYRWDNNLEEGQLLTPGDEPVYPYAGAAAIHPSKPLVIFPKDKGGDVNYELYTLDYSKDILQKITGPIGGIFYTFWVNDDEWIVVGHDKQTVYAKSPSRWNHEGSLHNRRTDPRRCIRQPEEPSHILRRERGG